MIDGLQTLATMRHVLAGMSYKHLKFPTVSLRDTVPPRSFWRSKRLINVLKTRNKKIYLPTKHKKINEDTLGNKTK